MLWPKKNSFKEFANEKKFLRLENSPLPPPPITFLMVRPLGCYLRSTYLAYKDVHLKFSHTTTYRKGKYYT